MSSDFQDMSTAPTLTLDPFQGQEAKQPPEEQKKEEPALDDSILTEEERRTVDAFAKQIDLTNSTLVLQYGAGTQKKMADFSESALENVRSKDLGEVGELLTGVVKELKNFDEEEEKGFFGIFKKASNKIETMKAKYAKAETNVNEIVKVLEKHQVQLMKDTALLDKMYDLNLTYFKELSMYILAGKKKLQEVRSGELSSLTAKAQATGLPEDAQAAKRVLLSLSETVGGRLREAGGRAQVLSVGIRDFALRDASHQAALPAATNITTELYRCASRLFDQLWDGTPIRKLGIHTGHIRYDAAVRQQSLFDGTDYQKLERMDAAADRIRSRYGKCSLVRAALLEPPRAKKD